MKKVLLATTAVAAFVAFSGTAQAQDPGQPDFGATEGGGGAGSAFTVKTSGAVKFYLKYATDGVATDHRSRSDSDTDPRGRETSNSGLFTLISAELEINGAATTDNGTDITTHIDFGFSGNAADDSATTGSGIIGGSEQDINLNNFAVIDELSMKIAGNWGSVEMGGNDGAEDSFKIYGGSIAAGTGGIDGDAHGVNGGYGGVGAVGGSAGSGDSGDALKVTYLSPKFAGIQAGVSLNYVTDSDKDTNGGTFGAGVGIKYSGSAGGVDYATSVVWGDKTLAADHNAENDGYGGVGVGVKIGVAGVSIVLPVTVDGLGRPSRYTVGDYTPEKYNKSHAAVSDATFGDGVDISFAPGIAYAIPGGKANVSFTTNVLFHTGEVTTSREAETVSGYVVALSGDYALLPGVTLAVDLGYGSKSVTRFLGVPTEEAPTKLDLVEASGFSGVIRVKAAF